MTKIVTWPLYNNDSNTRRLYEISDLFGLQQLITEPTRRRESSSTLIDLIFTNYVDRIVCSGVSHIGISDHSLIYVYRKLSPAFPSKEHSTISYRNFKNFNGESFRNDIDQQGWTCNGSDDPNVLWADWKTKLFDVVNFHSPLQSRRARIKKSTRDQFRIKERHARSWCSQKNAMASNDPRDWAKYYIQ